MQSTRQIVEEFRVRQQAAELDKVLTLIGPLDAAMKARDMTELSRILKSLRNTNMSLEILRDTKIGHRVNVVRKAFPDTPECHDAKSLIRLWKTVVDKATGGDEEGDANERLYTSMSALNPNVAPEVLVATAVAAGGMSDQTKAVLNAAAARTSAAKSSSEAPSKRKTDEHSSSSSSSSSSTSASASASAPSKAGKKTAPENYESMKVPDLKKRLKDACMVQAGEKGTLIFRLKLNDKCVQQGLATDEGENPCRLGFAKLKACASKVGVSPMGTQDEILEEFVKLLEASGSKKGESSSSSSRSSSSSNSSSAPAGVVDPIAVARRVLELGETDDYEGILNIATAPGAARITSQSPIAQMRKVGWWVEVAVLVW